MSQPHGQSTFSIRSESEQDTMLLARGLAACLHPGDVITLEGPLGAGKTCFVRGLAAGLGLNAAAVSSPTFVICQEYEPDLRTGRQAQTLLHIDAYRLRGPVDLESIGWSEMLEAGDAIIAVEWPSNVAAALPPHRIEATLEHAGPHARQISVRGPRPVIDALKLSAANMPAAGKGPATAKTRCRICGNPTDPSAAAFPFCSERCRLADLGRWFNESYRTSRVAQDDDELDV